MRAFLGLLLLAASAAAQSTAGYIFAAPVREFVSSGGPASLSAYGIGGGIDHSLTSGGWGAFGIGAEVEGLVPGRGQASSSVGIMSANAVYHFLLKGNADIFVSGGYSLVFRDFTANGGNGGAGLNYWFRDHAAFRFEIRDQIAKPPIPPYSQPGFRTNYLGFRFGIAFGNRPGS